MTLQIPGFSLVIFFLSKGIIAVVESIYEALRLHNAISHKYGLYLVLTSKRKGCSNNETTIGSTITLIVSPNRNKEMFIVDHYSPRNGNP